MKDLLSPELAKHSRGYPVQFLFKDTAMPFGPRQQEGSPRFGMPHLPILVFPGSNAATEETELPTSADVLSQVRSFMNKTSGPRILTCMDWAQVAALTPVVADTNPSEFVWPYSEDGVESQASNDEGKSNPGL